MAEVPNVFDLVPTGTQPDAREARHASRLCSHETRLGIKCTRDAEPDAMVCKLHLGGKLSLMQLRKEALNLGPMAMQTLEELMMDDLGVVRLGAVKLWGEMSGFKDLPASGSGIEEEELEQARRSLARKLEGVVGNILQRKSA
jgi:hypothetical protein